MSFSRDPSCHIKTPMWNFYEEVYERKWCRKGLIIALLKESHEEYLQVSFQAYSSLMRCHEQKPQEPWRSRWPRERDVEQSALTHARCTQCISRQLGTTADWRCGVPRDWLEDACQMVRVHWETRHKGFCCKEGPHYWIERSARNPRERGQVQRALGKLSRSCRQTSNNQPWFTSLEIPWGFLAWAVLRWLSRGLCHARQCQFEDFEREEKVWFVIAQQKRWNGERKLVLTLVPGSRKYLASRKRVMCAKNMGEHIQRRTLYFQRYEKTGWVIGFPYSQERRKEASK